jgi:intracellular multiplication protein IcmL
MVSEELQIVRLRNDFYRDGFRKVSLAVVIIAGAIIILIASNLYLHFSKPEPVYFSTGDEWRVLSPVPLTQPYLSNADVTQWVSDTLPSVFKYDFVNYAKQLKNNEAFFTANGWKNFSDMLNNTFNIGNSVLNSKSFVNSSAYAAPFILNQGLLGEKYAWQIQIPVNISYSGAPISSANRIVTFKLLVVRVPTTNNLDGVAIEDVTIAKEQTGQGQR